MRKREKQKMKRNRKEIQKTGTKGKENKGEEENRK
jgi:hypothetical protein